MPKPTGPTNPMLKELIALLRREKKGIWRRAAEILSRPTRRRVEVNLSKINRYADKGTLLVPGVVLASGSLDKPVTVAAFRFSAQARRKIIEAGGRALGIKELMEENPDGKGVIIIT
jgi:large subunit ribosomal protein L18e